MSDGMWCVEYVEWPSSCNKALNLVPLMFHHRSVAHLNLIYSIYCIVMLTD